MFENVDGWMERRWNCRSNKDILLQKCFCKSKFAKYICYLAVSKVVLFALCNHYVGDTQIKSVFLESVVYMFKNTIIRLHFLFKICHFR